VKVLSVRPRLLVFSKFFWPEGGGTELAAYLDWFILDNRLI